MKNLPLVVFLLLPGGLYAQRNPRYTFSIDGPCGGTIVGPPGSTYDDGTGGAPYFTDVVTTGNEADRVPRMRPGHTWDIVLTSQDPIHDHYGAYTWRYGLGVEGPLRITDITLDGTAGCAAVWPQCRGTGGIYYAELTGPPDGAGPKTQENKGAVSSVILKFDGVWSLPPEGSEVVGKIRVSADFPEREGEIAMGKIFFTNKIDRWAQEVFPQVGGPVRFGPNIGLGSVTIDWGDPPLTVQECVVQVKTSSVAAFVRCDANEDGQVSISDAVWLLNELFLGGARTRCRPAADCDGDGEESLTDVVRGLSYLFLGGPPPPAPFSFCDRIDVPVEECPPGSTACP